LPATALLLFHPSDVAVQERLLASTAPTPVLVRDLWQKLRFSTLERRSTEDLAQVLGAGAAEVDAALKLLERAGHLERGVRSAGPAEVALLQPAAQRSGNPGLVLGSLQQRLGQQPEPLYLEELVGSTGLAEVAVRRSLVQLQREGIIAFRSPEPLRAVAVRTPGLPAERLAVDFRAEAARARQARRLLGCMEAYARTPGCRRAYLLNYFGEQAPEQCGQCDRCLVPRDPSADTSRALVEGGMSVVEVARLRGLSVGDVQRQVGVRPKEGARIQLGRIP
jgi:ATP-dependent DNA helicase RecQ